MDIKILYTVIFRLLKVAIPVILLVVLGLFWVFGIPILVAQSSWGQEFFKDSATGLFVVWVLINTGLTIMFVHLKHEYEKELKKRRKQ